MSAKRGCVSDLLAGGCNACSGHCGSGVATVRVGLLRSFVSVVGACGMLSFRQR